jgi:hypothetical protein
VTEPTEAEEYTVRGWRLVAAPLSALRKEAAAGRALMEACYCTSWAKLYAIEREIRRRETAIAETPLELRHANDTDRS